MPKPKPPPQPEYKVKHIPHTTTQLAKQLNNMHNQGYTFICCTLNHMIYKKTATNKKTKHNTNNKK